MRNICLLFCLGLLALAPALPGHAADRPLASGFTAPTAPFRAGMWWNPALDGSGMDIHLSGDRLFLVWYTYETDGAPVWYLAQGPFGGDAWSAPLQRFTWNAAAARASGETVGEVSLDFDGTYSATFEWTLGENAGAYPIEPLLVSEGISRYDHTGHWYSAGEPGYGVTFNDQGSLEFAVAYLYDADGEPRWALGSRAGELLETIQLQSFEGACPACEYTEPTPTAAGSLKREFDSATTGRLTLDVTFSQPVSGDWQRQSVPIQLLSERQDGRSHPAAMARFASAEALEAFLEEGIRSRPPYFGVPLDFSPPPAGFSGTTVQVAGVDEADTIETDGQRLYTLGDVEAAPGGSLQPVLRVLRLDGGEPGVEERGRVALPGEPYDERGMYLVAARPEGRPDMLAVQRTTGNIEIYYTDGIRAPRSTGMTQLTLVDVSAPTAPTVVSEWKIQGHLVASRRIGETLYLVTRYSADVAGFTYGAEDDAETEAENERLLAEATLADLLPDIQHNDDPPEELVDVDTTWLPPVFMERPMAELVTVSAFDLAQPDWPPATLTAIGQSEALFASTEALYLASTRYDYLVGPGGVVESYPNLIYTDIHKVAYAEGGPEYRGSASVEGHLGWNENHKPYRFGELGDKVLGLVTSSYDLWGDLGENRLTLLRETPRTAEHRLLEELAHVPSAARPARLGKPGDVLYATRFAGSRAYVLTARQVVTHYIDPLYVVDLSNRSDPHIAGSLEVTGYSDFLYPVNDAYVVGIGEDAVREESGAVVSAGLKVGVFDVSDPSRPRQAASKVVGWAGTTTPASQNPHAFGFLPEDPGAGRPARIAIPVMETRPDAGTLDLPPGTAQPWFQSGLYLFNLWLGPDGPQLSRPGEIITAQRNDADDEERYRHLDGVFSRSVITDANAYFVDEGVVWSAPWEAPGQQVGPQ